MSSNGRGWAGAGRMLGKGCLLLLINGLAGLGLLSLHAARLDYARWETDSKLLVMPRGQSFGLALLGSSHADIIGRSEENHRLCESLLETTDVNLASPSGGGVMPARFYLERFFARGNQAREVIYFLDPFVLFSPGCNEGHKFVYYEPLRLSMLRELVREGYPKRRIFAYVRSKFSWDWLTQGPELHPPYAKTLEGRETPQENIQRRFNSLYTEGLQERHFQKYSGELRRIAALCRVHGARLRLMVTPTLLGPEPGAERMHAWIAAEKESLGVTSHDFVNALSNRKLYYNLDHLNLEGLEHFLRDHVKPALSP